MFTTPLLIRFFNVKVLKNHIKKTYFTAIDYLSMICKNFIFQFNFKKISKFLIFFFHTLKTLCVSKLRNYLYE
jgi:hypothetical protein